MPFQKGNKLALGRHGRKSRDALSQVLTSILNEIDHETGQEKKYRLAQELYNLAVGYEEKIECRNGKIKIIKHLPNLAAIRELIDRVEGKAPQAISLDSPEGPPPIAFIERVIVHPNGERERIGEDPKVIDGNGPGERVHITRP